MALTGLQYATWLLAPVLQTVIIALMLRRGSWREYHFFLWYTVLHAVEVPVLFYVFHRQPQYYFIGYWSFVAASIVLGFAVIREIFSRAFEPYRGLNDLATTLYRWIVLVMVFVSIIVAEVAPGTDSQWVVSWVFSLDRIMRLMQCSLLLFLFLFGSRLGLSWWSRVNGISLGLGLYAVTEIILITIRSQIGGSSIDPTLSTIKSIAYNAAVLIWLVYFVRPEPQRRRIPLPQPDRWDFALLTLLHTSEENYISSIEETVDRVINGHTKGAALSGDA